MIAIGSDHGGFDLKEAVIAHLKEKGYEVKDVGCYDKSSCDYPVYGKAVANAVADGTCEKGIVICTTGIGISITANKVKGIRAVVCSEPYSARLSKQHNNTNILCFGARVIGIEMAKMIIEEWLNAEFEGGRHQDRVDMIMAIEENK